VFGTGTQGQGTGSGKGNFMPVCSVVSLVYEPFQVPETASISPVFVEVYK